MASSSRKNCSKNISLQGSGSMKCSNCPFQTNNKRTLELHETHHTENFGLKCLLCSFSCSTVAKVAMHTNRVHQKKKNSEANQVFESEPSDSTHEEDLNEDVVDDDATQVTCYCGHSRCGHKKKLHNAKLLKVVDKIKKEFPPSVTAGGQEKERKIKAKMAKLAQEITAAKVPLLKMKTSMEQETRRIQTARHLREKIEELETKNPALLFKKNRLMEQKGLLEKELTDLTKQKDQLQRELDSLKEAPEEKKIKLELPSSSESCTTSFTIQQKESLLSNVKVELTVIMEEDKDLLDRIRGAEKELVENARRLDEMRAERNSLNDEHQDGDGLTISNKLKAVKTEQRVRVAQFCLLEKKLLQISCGYVFQEINRKEEEWMSGLSDSDEDVTVA